MTSELKSISPSSIVAFDKTTPFGCERRWWFKYALGSREPQDPKMLLGEALHKRNEDFLLRGLELDPGQSKGAWTPEQDAKAHSLFQKGRNYLRELHAKGIYGVEQTMPEGFSVGGLRVSSKSKCDVVIPGGIVDWKTTSDISKYGKTPGQLAKDIQLHIYARAFHPNLEFVRLVHGQYQTTGREVFNVAETVVSKDLLDKHFTGYIIPLVERMKQVFALPAAKEVEPNRAACRRCPHQGICPSEKENPLMSIYNKFRSEVAAATPPDAPASSPSKAAKPVEGEMPPEAQRKLKQLVVDAPAVTAPAHTPVEKAPAPAPSAPVPAVEEDEEAALQRQLEAARARKAEAARKAAEEAAAALRAKEAAEEAARKAEETAEEGEKQEVETEKRGRGRPPGSKNKPKVEVVSTAVEGSKFVQTKVAFGITQNLGINVGAVRFDVEHTIAYSDGDFEAAFSKALEEARRQVERAASEFGAELEKQQARK